MNTIDYYINIRSVLNLTYMPSTAHEIGQVGTQPDWVSLIPHGEKLATLNGFFEATRLKVFTLIDPSIPEEEIKKYSNVPTSDSRVPPLRALYWASKDIRRIPAKEIIGNLKKISDLGIDGVQEKHIDELSKIACTEEAYWHLRKLRTATPLYDIENITGVIDTHVHRIRELRDVYPDIIQITELDIQGATNQLLESIVREIMGELSGEEGNLSQREIDTYREYLEAISTKYPQIVVSSQQIEQAEIKRRVKYGGTKKQLPGGNMLHVKN